MCSGGSCLRLLLLVGFLLCNNIDVTHSNSNSPPNDKLASGSNGGGKGGPNRGQNREQNVERYPELRRDISRSESRRIKVDKLGNTLKDRVSQLRRVHEGVDLVFLVDSSASVGSQNFYNEIKFIRKVYKYRKDRICYFKISKSTF